MARRFTHVVHSADIRMTQRRSRAGFTLETLSRSLCGKSLGQNFNGYVAMQPGVARPIHLAHPAGADRGKDLVRAESFTWLERHLNESAKFNSSRSRLLLGDGASGILSRCAVYTNHRIAPRGTRGPRRDAVSINLAVRWSKAGIKLGF